MYFRYFCINRSRLEKKETMINTEIKERPKGKRHTPQMERLCEERSQSSRSRSKLEKVAENRI